MDITQNTHTAIAEIRSLADFHRNQADRIESWADAQEVDFPEDHTSLDALVRMRDRVGFALSDADNATNPVLLRQQLIRLTEGIAALVVEGAPGAG